MRTLLPSRLFRSNNATATKAVRAATASNSAAVCRDPRDCLRSCRCFAHVHDIDKLNRDVYFNSSVPRFEPVGSPEPHKPPDERTLQLGKTVRTLHERLPTLLQSPLPSEILSPQISLHLFPSTHQHLPKVSGRIAYVAALWTAPVAWGRVPLVGNVKLTILSERMVKSGGNSTDGTSWRDEKLIVKWKTCGKPNKAKLGSDGNPDHIRNGTKDPVDWLRQFLAPSQVAGSGSEEFTGLFIFSFDSNGRIVKHVIEHTDEGGHYDHMTRVVSVTDWLLGQFNGKKKEQLPELAWCEERPRGRMNRMVDRRNGQ
jgi:hypothetical protein